MFFKRKKVSGNELYQKFFYLIDKYETIVVFYHKIPDFDALGSAYGLSNYLKDNYPNKRIYVVGESHPNFTGKLFPPADIVSDVSLVDNPFLAIVVDTSVSNRISDDRYVMAKEIIKVDHHLEKNEDSNYGNLKIVYQNVSSAAELVADIIISHPKNKISKTAAKFLYTGIVGDSGRFLYAGTSMKTFNIAAKLIETGFDIRAEVYEKMYHKSIDTLKIQAYLLNNFHLSPNGVAFYVLSEEVLEKFDILPTAGKEHINLFSSIDEIGIWVSFAEDIEIDKESNSPKKFYRVSIRSSKYDVSQVASNYRGGGHRFACGARVYSEDEINSLIEELDQLIANETSIS